VSKGGCPSPCRYVVTLLVKNPTPPRPWSACVPARPRPSRPPAPLMAAAASSGSGRLHAKPSSPPPSLAPTLAHQPSLDPCIEPPPPVSQSRRPPPLAAGAPLAGLLPAPTKPRNRPPRTRGSIPARARPVPAGGSPEFGRTAAGWCLGTALRSSKSS
jgi:hypothetical protein